MPWAGVPLKRRTTHAIAMPVTATCCCMSRAMTGGKSREWRKMNSVASAMTGQNRTLISLHGCMTVEVIPRWQSSPRMIVIPSCKTTWVRLYRLLTAREMWSGTVYLTYMAMCWNSEGKGALYLLDSKDSMKMRRYMASNPGSQRKAFDAVLDAAREIDFKHGTDITSKFWQNIYKGNFKVHP